MRTSLEEAKREIERRATFEKRDTHRNRRSGDRERQRDRERKIAESQLSNEPPLLGGVWGLD